ncbi:hypothetical protein ABVT39_010149, partial [Epinephelus coioides]
MGPYEQMENIREGNGQQRVLALQIHKRIVSAKRGNCKERGKQGQRRDRGEMRKARESRENRDGAVLCIICSHIFRLSACIEAWALIIIGWVLKRRIISLDVEASLHYIPLLALPSKMNLNCLPTKKRAAHFSTPLSLYRKVSGELSRACSILDDTLNPIWLKYIPSLFCIPFLLIVCVIADACLRRAAFACANLCGRGQMCG